MQDAQASALGALDEYPATGRPGLIQHQGRLADVRVKLRHVPGQPYRTGNAPLLDSAGERRAASGTGRPDRILQAGLALDVVLFDDQGARVDG